jgi:archaellum component FlaC
MYNVKPLYPNLICPAIENTPLKLRIFKVKNDIKVQVENLEFRLISKYLNEIGAFVDDIQNELGKSKAEILGGLKKPRRKQVIEELERQIKTQGEVKVSMVNSSVLMPEDSHSKNYIRIFFQRADIKSSKKKICI